MVLHASKSVTNFCRSRVLPTSAAARKFSTAREMIKHGTPRVKLEARAQRRRHVTLGAAHSVTEIYPQRKISGDRRRQRAPETMCASPADTRRAQFEEV